VIATGLRKRAGGIALLPVRAGPTEKEITISRWKCLRVPEKVADREEKEEVSEWVYSGMKSIRGK
jgi:hypothetical protein